MIVRAVLHYVVLIGCMTSATAAEYQQLEGLAPESAEQAAVGLDSIDKALERNPRRKLLRDALIERSPFWRDSSLSLNLRLYDFQRESDAESLAEAFAAGSELIFRSGSWRDKVSLELSWHTSSAIDAPDNLGRTGLLAPDQSDLSVISRANLQYHLDNTTLLKLYRQDFNMPYINRQDSRMIPNSYEAYVFSHAGERLQWIAGQVTKMKRRDSEEFVPMAEIAGVAGDDSGTSVVGARYGFANDATVGAILQNTNDLFATAYFETSYKRTISKDWGMQVAAQFTNQASVGSEELGDFSTYAAGLRGKLSFRGAVLTAAYTKIGDAAIRSPFGGTPGFTSSMLFDFDRANEEGYRFGLSQNFAKYGLPGASVILSYTKGWNADSDSGMALLDEEELDITVDFRPPEGKLKGFWLRVRYADGDRGSAMDDRSDVRVILNYSLSAFESRR